MILLLSLLATTLSIAESVLFTAKSYSSANDLNVYDFIIVGCGTSGGVIASRLSENPNFRVICIEKGPNDFPNSEEWSGLKIPDNFHFVSPHDPNVYVKLGNRNIYIPQVNGIGGTSKIYGMLNARPHPDVLASWPKGWRYDDLLPYFKKSEDHYCYYDSFDQTQISKKDCELFHGKNGPLQVNNLEQSGFHYISQAFTEICHNESQIWEGFGSDYNGNPKKGAGCVVPQQFKSRSNRFLRNATVSRANSRTGYLRQDVLDRPNLTILVDSTVTRIVFDDSKTAIGVEHFDPITNQIKFIRATKEVILSAGVFSTPHLLQVSGVGDPEHLKKINVSVVVENDQVGKNLWDHVHIPYVFELNHCDERFNQVNGPFSWFLLFNSGARNSQSLSIRDIQVALVDSSDGVSYKFKLGNLYKESLKNCSLPGTKTISTFQIVLNYNNFRYGSVKSVSNSIFDKPIIDLNITKINKEDRNALVNVVNILREHTMNRKTKFSNLVFQELLPGDSDLDEFIKENLESTFHAACSCRLGFCTDKNLLVKGAKSLRVCDASSFGSQVDGNPTATIYAMAELFSDRLKQQYSQVTHETRNWRMYETLQIFESENKLSRKKIAVFDFENTIVSSIVGNVWHLYNEFVVPKINYLYSIGYKIVIFANQEQLCGNKDEIVVNKWRLKVESVLSKLNVPVQFYAATCKDNYYKPNIGIWKHFTWELNEGIDMDFKSSFFVGSAELIQNQIDHSNIIFSSKIPLKFYLTKEFFVSNNLTMMRHFDVVQSIRIDVPADDVWNVVGGFFNLHYWHPRIHSTKIVNSQNSIIRDVLFVSEDNFKVNLIEKLISYDDKKREYRYKNIGGLWGKIQENYEGKISVISDNNEKSSIVTWSGSFDALDDGSSDFYRTGLDSLAKLF